LTFLAKAFYEPQENQESGSKWFSEKRQIEIPRVGDGENFIYDLLDASTLIRQR
jgi:hypothetical protein